ncbi:MAG: AmmeMemoRadiSam system protein B [Desulfomonilaceae bacterium]
MNVRRRTLPTGWYPGTAKECEREILHFLQGFELPEGKWNAGVAPHAGWGFSGRASAKVAKTLSSGGSVERVVIFGGHLPGGYDPIAYMEDAWDTPFGPQDLDADLTYRLVNEGHASPVERGFSDNTIEIQLPMVRYFFPGSKVIAVHSPSSERAIELARNVKGLLDEKKLKSVFIGSADLTHYGPNYGFVPKGTGAASLRWVKEENDRTLIEKAINMEALDLIKEARIRQNTCSAGPIASIIEVARLCGSSIGRLLDYYTSYDILPGPSFVGYAAIVY